MAEVVVIGIGSDLRGDDAVGRLVAATMEGRREGVRVLSVHQLTPELAADLAAARRAVFVDAAIGIQEVAVRPVAPAGAGGAFAHHATPEGLLALAEEAYGWAPEGWVVSVPAERFDLGAGLSEVSAAGFGQAAVLLRELVAGPDDRPHQGTMTSLPRA